MVFYGMLALCGANKYQDVVYYMVSWRNTDGRIFYEFLSPTRGELKPNNAHINKLICKEGIHVEPSGWDNSE